MVGWQAEAQTRAETEARLGRRERWGRAEVTKVGLGVRFHSEVIKVWCRIECSGGHASEDEVEGAGLLAAVDLGLDLLRVSVRCQLLVAALHHQEQAVVFRVWNFKLVRTQLTHFLHSGVRPHLQGFGGTAAVQLLQSHPQVILGNRQTKKFFCSVIL